MTEFHLRASPPLVGHVHVPGDKSISHRAAILAALGDGETQIDGFLQSETTRATLECLRGLGVEIEEQESNVRVHGRGLQSWREPSRILYCAGSGTTMRLMAGVCAGHEFLSILDGTEALKRRPMARIAEPLRRMGATVLGREGGRLPPLAIQGGRLRGVNHDLNVASAQVKSALLLAGLFADGPTSVREPGPSRDHTERMLAACRVRIETRKGLEQENGERRELGKSESSPMNEVRVWPAARIENESSISVPGDFSSAAFLIAAGLLIPGSNLCIWAVGTNPTRIGLLDVLAKMTAQVEMEEARDESNEPVASLIVREQPELRGVQVGGEVVPRMIDEFPILAVLATQARGETRVRDAAELRVKESDRITTLVEELRKMGAQIEPSADGFVVEGPTRLRGARVSAHNDHRLAMSLAVAGMIATGDTVIEGWECVRDSFPDFEALITRLSKGGAQA